MHSLSVSPFIQFLALLAPVVLPVPLSDRSSGKSASTTAVSNATIDDDFARPAQFSRIAYCSSAAVEAWNCGSPCQALGMNGVTPLIMGGGVCFLFTLGIIGFVLTCDCGGIAVVCLVGVDGGQTPRCTFSCHFSTPYFSIDHTYSSLSFQSSSLRLARQQNAVHRRSPSRH